MAFRRTDILTQLDRPESEGVPMLDHGYYYLADVRLLAYRDDERWGIVFNTLICSSTDCGHKALRNQLYCFGNRLRSESGFSEECIWIRTSDPPEEPVFTSRFGPHCLTEVSPVTSIRIRDQVVPIATNREDYTAAGIRLEDPMSIWNFELLRWMAPRYRSLLMATDEECQQCFTERIPLFMRLDQWRHPDVVHGEKASDLQTFQMLAEALVTGDPSRYHPTEAPNTHWSNWPLGGSL
jgi:hypothetical protein